MGKRLWLSSCYCRLSTAIRYLLVVALYSQLRNVLVNTVKLQLSSQQDAYTASSLGDYAELSP